MKRGRMAAAVSAGLVVSATVAGAPAGAGEPTPTGTITIDPPIGQPGTPSTAHVTRGPRCMHQVSPGNWDGQTLGQGGTGCTHA
jgi:hypothetical protein